MSQFKILIIEDDPNLLRAYEQIISKAGYEVIKAGNGKDGLEICRDEQPDLILLDAVLPDDSGIELCQKIKEGGNLPNTFVLMISGQKTSPEYLAEGLEAGADGYLTKPVEDRILLAQIKAMMRLKKAEQDFKESEERYRQLNEELKATNQRLEEYNRLKAEFIANMSHELRTPLTAIIGFAQLVQIRPPSTPMPPEATLAFERILRNGRHLLNLIDEVLDIAKIEAGRLKIHREHFDMAELATGAFYELQSLAQQKGLEYRLKIPQELPLALTDPVRVRQIMNNLLSNAIKFTNKGSVEVELLPHGEDGCQFIVRDTGIGIDEKSRDFIFERFRQVDGSITRVAGGTGLGLSIVKQIIQLLGGEIEVSSKIGEGSVFTVTLPLSIPEIAVTDSIVGETLPMSKVTEYTDGTNKGPLILIIEDDQDMANLMYETVSKAGYRVKVTTNGAKGLQIARETEDLSAIILDIMMPGMDGWKVLQALKAETQTAEIPTIICSIVDNRPLGYRLGASNYFVKPVNPSELINTLQNINSNGTGDTGGYVLVVDDEHGIRELLVGALKKTGFNARSAASGETALRMMSKSAPRAVLCDLMMPGGMSGYELIARMRSSSQTEHIPVIVITGKDITQSDRRLIIGEIANVIRKGELLMSDLEMRLRHTLEEIGVNPSSGENISG
ncbi:MAG: response regulator [Acidobacteriota bacterium]|nr:response regulator [Acidobacteriota bacterium]